MAHCWLGWPSCPCRWTFALAFWLLALYWFLFLLRACLRARRVAFLFPFCFLFWLASVVWGFAGLCLLHISIKQCAPRSTVLCACARSALTVLPAFACLVLPLCFSVCEFILKEERWFKTVRWVV